MKKMEYITSIENIDFFLFHPTFFCLYPKIYPVGENPPYINRIVHKIRMILQILCGGYRVYYMYVEKNIVGHIVVMPGGNRVAQSKKKDIVIGPIWIVPSQREKGFATKGINAILHKLNIQYEKAYEFISCDNTPSIRTVEKNEFKFLGKAAEKGIFKKILLSDDGHWRLYCFSSKE
ncbi:MAG: GNAT family N-acetyltransferase [Alphaproteobacteria bacterium]|nr:GNAT family N-acetyltransferase [Alphaproteobacteria bacterium]